MADKSKKLPLNLATVAAKKLVGNFNLNTSDVPVMAAQLRRGMIHGGMGSRVERYARGGENAADKAAPGKASLESTLLTLASKPGYPGPGPVKTKSEPKLSKISPTAVKLTTKSVASKPQQLSLFDLSEDCGCEKPNKKITEKIKEKYLKEVIIPERNIKFDTKQLSDFNTVNFSKFMGKKVLAETTDGTFFGVLGTVKNKPAIYKNEILEKVLDSDKLLKFVCENTKLTFKYPVNDFLQEKKIHKGGKILVTNKAGTKVLGTHTTEAAADAQLNAIHANQAKSKKMHESSELLLKENIKNKFFIKEEVVNPGNEFTMTNAEIQDRDKRAESMLASPNFDPVLKNGDTKEEAAHRIATAAVIGERSGKGYQGGLFGGEDERKEKKYSRRETRDLRRLTRGDKEEKKYEKTRGSRGSEKTATKTPEDTRKARQGKKAERRTFSNVKGTKGAKFGKASKDRNEQTYSRSRYRKK